MSNWIRTDYDFPLHAANLVLGYRSLHRWFGQHLTRLGDDPAHIAQFVTLLLGAMNGGQWRDAQILRVCQPLERLCWTITKILREAASFRERRKGGWAVCGPIPRAAPAA